MSEFLVNSGSGVTEMALSTGYALGDRIVINRDSVATNYLVARQYVWECTTAGVTDSVYPAYSASYTPDTSTLTSGTAVFTCRNPGYSSGSTKDWSFATPFLAYAHKSAVTENDVIKVHKTHTETWDINFYTAQSPVASISVICVDKDNSEALAVMDPAYGIITGATAYIFLYPSSSTKWLYYYGIAFKSGEGAISSQPLIIGGAYDIDVTMEWCHIWIASTAATYIRTSGSGIASATFVKWKNTVFRFGASSQYMTAGYGAAELEGCSISALGSTPTTLFVDSDPGGKLTASGCDLSNCGTLVGDINDGHHTFEFSNCKIPGTVWNTGTPLIKTRGGGEAFVFNCASGDTHYAFGYYNNVGSVEAITAIYANDGALYDGTNHVTWKITTTAYCSSVLKFETPWIEKYHAGVAAITPYLEILRDGSTTAYQDDEVYGEFSYQGTAGSPIATFVNDGMLVLGTPADQAAGVGLSGWTGEGASAWSGKLAPASAITPAEIGFLRARVVVGEPSITVYVDPKVRT